MITDNRESSLHEAVDGSISWLISFGDLLTLLFCFFLVLTPRLGGISTNQSGNSEVSSIKADDMPTGTRLANQHQEAPEVLVASAPILFSKVYSLQGEERRQQFESAFELLKRRKGTLPSRATVRVCESSSSAENVIDLYAAARKIYGELRSIEFEYVTRCDRAAFPVGSDEDLAAVIEFSV
jgi:flagellar motor protein MotB